MWSEMAIEIEKAAWQEFQKPAVVVEASASPSPPRRWNLRLGGQTSLSLDSPDLYFTPDSSFALAQSYDDLDDIIEANKNLRFGEIIDNLSGLSKLAYQQHKPRLFRSAIDLDDILSQDEKINSSGIAAILSETAEDLGLRSYSANVIEQDNATSHTIVLVQEKGKKDFYIIDRDQVINTQTSDPELALEQWSRSRGRVHWLTEIYHANGKPLYVGVNSFGDRIRPTNIDYAEEDEQYVNGKFDNTHAAVGFAWDIFGIEVGALRDYGALDWSPYFRFGVSHKIYRDRSSPRYYLDTSYVKGGIGFYYFTQEDERNKSTDMPAVFTEIGGEYALGLDPENNLELVLGGDFLSNWVAYADTALEKLEIETVPAGYYEVLAGLRQTFSLSDQVWINWTRFLRARYTQSDIQAAFPSAYIIYGMSSRVLWKNSFGNLVTEVKVEAAAQNEHEYFTWETELLYEQDFFQTKINYKERRLIESWRRTFRLTAGLPIDDKMVINMQGRFWLPDNRYGLLIGFQVN